MADDAPSTLDPAALAELEEANARRWRSRLQGVIIFLLPCSRMSDYRRSLLLSGIHAKGGAVTTIPSQATHCVVSIPLGGDTALKLLREFQVPASCKLVSDTFLYD